MSTADNASPVSAKPPKQTVLKAPVHHSSNVLPQLKQKTGIIKSKVPPPVPPRGSPRDRRGGHQSSSSRSMAYETNTKEDKHSGSRSVSKSNRYLVPSTAKRGVCQDLTVPNQNDFEMVPKFGACRSPSCVDDWLELNDLHIKSTTTEPNRRIFVHTKVLTRDTSFHAIKPMKTVPFIIQSFSNPSIHEQQTKNISDHENKSQLFSQLITSNATATCEELDDLRKSLSVSTLLSTTFKSYTAKNSDVLKITQK